MFKKKNKKKKETAEELKAKLRELEGVPEESLDVPPELPEPPKPPKPTKEKKIGEATLEVKGEFSLNENEMALVVNALINSEEFKLYQQMVIGEQAANIIASYNKAVEEKSEVPSEDTEEELPEPQ